jgi:hypothetical protein
METEYNKPKLVESKIIKKIKNNNNNIIIIQNYIYSLLYDFLLNNYKFIILILFLLLCLYWRYIDTQKKNI